MAYSWNEELKNKLICEFGDKEGNIHFNNYNAAFSSSYCEKTPTETAICDIRRLQLLKSNDDLEIEIHDLNSDKNGNKNLRLFKFGDPIALSDILPILENIGLRTLYEESYILNLANDMKCSIISFVVTYNKSESHDHSYLKSIFELALKDIILKKAENDGFNKLVISGCIPVREISIIRAYSKFLAQIKYRYTQTFIEKTVVDHVDITRNILQLFKAIHSPHQSKESNESNESLDSATIESQIDKQLESVKNIGEDSVIRRLILLIKATLRTNYFQTNTDGSYKDYITLKLNSQAIPDLPLPKPLIDTFVYSSYFEGIHLRSHKVSRGGIRWSDRHDDYRTEILGLMKAQKVKNSVIIPSGAKGGFILKEAAINSANGELKKCIIQCYQQFIRGLLDVSDNMKDGIVCHPANVVCRDDFDPYFVVAADKGTADLSDYANSISNEYSFWLGDAFASGGSNGYDHKKLGITARGAWESLKRSLQELNLSNSVITAVGVGDMSGDVFGNGFIYSDKIKLLAAFDHRHIFIDPNPIPDVSYQERLRLFKLPTSSWDDYSKILLSDGGGIYKRSEKSIKLSPQAKEALGIDHDELTPDQLICYILKAPVDLLYNGGIGTYVKASHETSENVGDKTNEFCRVNGNELRCKIVCEGGNLGFTQLARVEYALNGGQINTDFIDNSAGVDCSDHEVNIKILLNSIVNANHMTIDERNKILAEMEQDVSNIVLNDNYSQALVMSFSSMHSHAYSDLYIDHIKRLEEVSNLDRTIENLPTNEELINRKAAGKGLTKPELAVLLAYTKIYVKEEILKSSLPDNPFFDQILISSFPARLTTEFKDSISDHILRREIIATQISNNILNTMGVTFPFRLQDETGASISNIAIAHTLASLVYNTSHLYSQIQSFDNKIPVKSQYELLHTVRVLLNMSTRWFLRNCSMDTNLSEIVENYKSSIGQLSEVIPNLVVGSTKNYVNKITIQFIDSGLPTDIAQTIALSRVMYTALNISAVSSTHEFDLVKTAKLYFHIGSVFNLVWFRDTLANDNRHGKRSNLARLTLRDDLDTLQRRLTISIMQSDMAERDVVKLVSTWISDNKEAFERWNTTFKNLMECQSDDYTMYFIALRELSDMVSDTNMSERVSLLAYHDALTKLPNRFAIADRIDQLQKRSQTEDIKFAVHFIDVDKFKEINDNYGHAVGDKLLIEITKRLLSTVRSGDTVARQGGDEFIIIQTELSTISDAKQLADKLLRLIKEPIMIDNHCLNVSASIGVAVYPSHGNDPMELLTNADKAMYHSKSSGRSQVSIHKSSTSIA